MTSLSRAILLLPNFSVTCFHAFFFQKLSNIARVKLRKQKRKAKRLCSAGIRTQCLSIDGTNGSTWLPAYAGTNTINLIWLQYNCHKKYGYFWCIILGNNVFKSLNLHHQDEIVQSLVVSTNMFTWKHTEHLTQCIKILP